MRQPRPRTTSLLAIEVRIRNGLRLHALNAPRSARHASHATPWGERTRPNNHTPMKHRFAIHRCTQLVSSMATLSVTGTTRSVIVEIRDENGTVTDLIHGS